MTINVWFKNRQWCDKWFDDFLEKIDKDAIWMIIKSKIMPPRIKMKNGNYIRGVSAVEIGSKGCRADVAYLEPGIEKSQVLRLLILPTMYEKNNIYKGFYGGQVKLDGQWVNLD